MAAGLALAAATSFVAACSSSNDAPAGSTATTALTVRTVLDRSADAMAAIDTVGFHLIRTGAPVYLDKNQSLAFEDGKGRYSKASSSADAVVKITALGVKAQVGAVSINGELLLSNPLTGTWEPAPASITFDPLTLFDPDKGWTPLLRTDLADPKLLGDAPAGQHHVAGTAAGARMAVITGGLVTTDAPIDLWIDDATGHVVKATFNTTSSAGQTSWEMDLSDYGVAVSITRPPVGAKG